MNIMIKKMIEKFIKKRPIVMNVNYVSPNNIMSGKNIVIFGGTGEIGFEIAKKIRDAGGKVIICGRKNERNLGKEIDFELCDLSDCSFYLEYINKLSKKYGKISIVVNAQGICPSVPFDDITKISPKEFDDVININLKSVYFMNLASCKYFEVERINGHILNIASTEGLKGGVVPYGLSKSGVVSLTKGLGKWMIDKNIVINGIAPGATATKMMGYEKGKSLYMDYIPSKRMSLPEEIANVALLLVSDMGNNMCGEIVNVDGGESLH